MTEKQFLAGHTKQGEPFWIPYSTFSKAHWDLRGNTGCGKTIFQVLCLLYLIAADARAKARSCKVIVDPTPDGVIRQALKESCEEHGVPFIEFWPDVLSLSSFELLQGFDCDYHSPTLLAAFLLSAAGCDYGPGWGKGYFRGESFVTALSAINRLRAAGEGISLQNLIETMEAIDRKQKRRSEITNSLAPLCFVSNIADKSESKEIDVADAIDKGAVMYFALDLLEYPIVAETLARLVVANVVLAQIKRNKLNKSPVRTFLTVDEWGQMATYMDSRILTTVRKHHLNVSFLYQNMHQVSNACPGLNEILEANARMHFYFTTEGEEIKRMQDMCSKVRDTLGGSSGTGLNANFNSREFLRPSLTENELLDCSATDRDFFLVLKDGAGHRDPIRLTAPTVSNEALQRWSKPLEWAAEPVKPHTEPPVRTDAGSTKRNERINTLLQDFFDTRIRQESYSE